MNRRSSLYSKLEFDSIKERLKRYASSDLGKQLVDEIAPFSDLRLLQEELDRVTECKLLLETDEPCPLDGLKDVRSAIHKASIEDSFLSAPELRSIFETLRTCRLVHQFFKKRPGRYLHLSKIVAGIQVDRVLEYNVEQAIDENGVVKDGASKELREVRRSIIAKSDELRMRLDEILKGLSEQGYAQEEIITTREGRMVIPVKVEHKHHVPGFIHSSSATGATVFVEPAETLEMNNEIRSLRFSEQREIERLLRALTAQVRQVATHIHSNVNILAQLDLDFAKARYSIEIIGSRPQITDQGQLCLLQARHPILLQKHKRDEVVPIDIELGKNFSTLIITGPNAGGKTVALKTVGLLSLMASCALHVPASADSQIPLFKQIFIDIGDDQSIENDLSSFTSHLLNLKQIIEQVDGCSLVLIDEIGAGTDPTEGGALAAAVLSKLTTAGSLIIATTHHGALKAFAHETPGFENGAMEFDQDTLRPTYRFTCGVPGSSYALEIASRLGLPESVISTARELHGQKGDRLESLLASMEKKFQQLEEEQKSLSSQNSHLADLIQRYERKLRSADQEIRDKKAAAATEAEEIVTQANALIERSIRDIRTESASRDAVTEAKRQVLKMKEDLKDRIENLHQEAEESAETYDFHEGDYVKLKGHNGVGQIISSSADGGILLVEFGELRMRVNKKELALSTPTEEPRALNPLESESRTVRREIDLRGMTGDEAIGAVDKFLDDALLVALRSVSIIHGKGTGALRKKIGDYLKIDPRVKSYRLADWNQGGTGATIVELNN